MSPKATVRRVSQVVVHDTTTAEDQAVALGGMLWRAVEWGTLGRNGGFATKPPQMARTDSRV